MKGYLPHPVVKSVVFWILTLCILCVTAASVFMVWDGIEKEVAGSLIETALVLAAGSVVFLLVNLAFGSLFREWFSPRPSQPLDPAFAERLQRAKDSSRSETSRKAE